MTGQPRRGSAVGAWTSDARADWVGTGISKCIVLKAPTAPIGKEWELTIDSESGEASSITLVLTDQDRKTLVRKESSEGRFVFVESSPAARDTLRMTLARKSRDRWTALLEVRRSAEGGWARLNEFGLTRRGTTIAVGNGQPECVVTGGLGDIAVVVGGKTVYVCCSGCREALLADPSAFIGEPRQDVETERNRDRNRNP